MSDLIINSTDESFENDVINSDLPVLVDFWAEWCGPCKMIAPLLEALAEEMAGKIKIVKVNIDSNEEITAKHGIRSIPTLLLFKNGSVAATKIGAAGKTELSSFVEENIA